MRGQQPLPNATARGDMRGASGTIAFMQLFQTADKPIWHASIQPSPTEGKGDRERSEAVEEVVEVLDFTKFFELNSGHHLFRQLACDCVGIGSLPPSPP